MNNPTATFLLLQRLYKKYRQRPNGGEVWASRWGRSGWDDWNEMCEVEFDCHDHKLNDEAYEEYKVESKKRIGKRRFKNRKGK
jgi:hypothetical protein